MVFISISRIRVGIGIGYEEVVEVELSGFLDGRICGWIKLFLIFLKVDGYSIGYLDDRSIKVREYEVG